MLYINPKYKIKMNELGLLPIQFNLKNKNPEVMSVNLFSSPPSKNICFINQRVHKKKKKHIVEPINLLFFSSTKTENF